MPARDDDAAIIRPARKAIPDRIKLEIYIRQMGRCADTGQRLASIWRCEFDHRPPLALRAIADDGSDFVPAQLDPDYIAALHPDAHRAKTSEDQTRIAKAKRLAAKGGLSKRTGDRESGSRQSRWPKRAFPKRPK